MSPRDRTVLILGAGINGAALARELSINGVGVCVVDTADIAGGSTSYSSRLIHGGLRYLEFGEFDLVRESLGERSRLLKLAPNLVRPLRLFIPVERRFGGLLHSAARFFHVPVGASTSRGLNAIRVGLWLYDEFAADPDMPRHSVERIAAVPSGRTRGAGAGLGVDASRYRWLCSYMDAQAPYPERFTLALLKDAERAARAHGSRFEVLTYHRAMLRGRAVEISPVQEAWDPAGSNESGTFATSAASAGKSATGVESSTERGFEPSLIVNATGAWVDETLARLHVASDRLIGGTKGVHFLTHAPRLCERLGNDGLYAEATDGRPIFVLPLATGVLVGTTDDPFTGLPQSAVATEEELEYLLASVNRVFAGLDLRREEIAMHYAGVRPLPFVGPKVPAAITRRHALHRHENAAVPLYSIIGGKLTTCRSLAEEVVQAIAPAVGLDPHALKNSRWRPLPGGDLKTASATTMEPIGNAADDLRKVAGTDISRGLVRWSIRNEWAGRLADLVERRLMLLFEPKLGLNTLDELAQLLVAEGRMAAADRDAEIETERARLHGHFGIAAFLGGHISGGA